MAEKASSAPKSIQTNAYSKNGVLRCDRSASSPHSTTPRPAWAANSHSTRRHTGDGRNRSVPPAASTATTSPRQRLSVIGRPGRALS